MPVNNGNNSSGNTESAATQLPEQIPVEQSVPTNSTENSAVESSTAANNSTSINGNNVGAVTDTLSTTAGTNETEAKNDAPVVSATTLPNKESATESELRAQLSLTESKLHAASVILSERERQLEVRSEEQARDTLFIAFNLIWQVN